MGHWKFMVAILKMTATALRDQYNCQNWILWLWSIEIETIINLLSILFAEIWDIEYSWRPFWKWLPQTPQPNIFTIFGFWDPNNNDKNTKINFLSILFAEMWDIENSWRPFWKWLPQPPQTHIIAKFGFLDPENIDIETIINFLSILFAEISDIEYSCQPFLKWLPPPPQAKSGWGPVLE